MIATLRIALLIRWATIPHTSVSGAGWDKCPRSKPVQTIMSRKLSVKQHLSIDLLKGSWHH